MGLKSRKISGKEYYLLNNEFYTGKVEITYEQTGELKTVGYFYEGLKMGEWYYFYEGGATERIENYLYGELTGIYMALYKNGKLKEIGQMKNDKMNDKWYFYYDNGKKQYENFYYLGKQSNGEWKEYYENGSLKIKCPTMSGYLYGECKEYDEEGYLIRKCFMRDSKKNGYEVEYNRSGKEISRTNYVSGVEMKD